MTWLDEAVERAKQAQLETGITSFRMRDAFEDAMSDCTPEQLLALAEVVKAARNMNTMQWPDRNDPRALDMDAALDALARLEEL